MRNLKYTFILFYSLISANAFGQTVVNSYNGSDTVWEKANSPYHITGQVIVPSGRGLVIEPGVKVIFKGYYSLDIRGSLSCQGTAADNIWFRGDSLSPTASVLWRGITVSKSTGAPVFPFRMRYCNVENSQGVITSGNIRNNIAHCNFYNNNNCFGSGQAGINTLDTIINCSFEGNGVVFVDIPNSLYVLNSTFTDNDFFNNMDWCLFKILKNCTLNNCGLMSVYSDSILNVVMKDCYSKAQSWSLPTYWSSRNIKYCTFQNTLSNKHLYTISLTDGTLMTDCVFDGLDIAVRTEFTGTGKCRITRSNFIHNDTALFLKSVNDFTNIVACNTIENNKVGIICSNGQRDSVKNNIICGNTIYNVINTSSVSQNLTQNCFCADSSAQAEKKLYDRTDNVSLGVINYNLYGKSGINNCKILDSIIAKDPQIMDHTDSTAEVDLGCIDYRNGPEIIFDTPDTICHKVNTPYTSKVPSLRSSRYTNSVIALVSVNPGVVNPNVPGIYEEKWQATDPKNNVTKKSRFVIVGDCDTNHQSISDISVSRFRIGPNPAGNEVNIFVPVEDETQIMKISLWDISGREVYHMHAPMLDHTINVADLPPGIYSLRIITGSDTGSYKIMIQH